MFPTSLDRAVIEEIACCTSIPQKKRQEGLDSLEEQDIEAETKSAPEFASNTISSFLPSMTITKAQCAPTLLGSS
jgi:hypothetical protein